MLFLMFEMGLMLLLEEMVVDGVAGYGRWRNPISTWAHNGHLRPIGVLPQVAYQESVSWRS